MEEIQQDDFPDYAKAWVAELTKQYAHWPAGSVKAIVEMYLKRPELFHPDIIAKWGETRLPDEIANPPRQGVIETYALDSEEHAKLQAMTDAIAEQQRAEVVNYADADDGNLIHDDVVKHVEG